MEILSSLDTKRPYENLADYAAQQGAPVENFIAHGYDANFCIHQDRPALRFKTPGGRRWRFMDGNPDKSKYTSETGFKTCWFSLDSAVAMSRETGKPLVMVNGEAGVVVAQDHGLPAFCLSGGENTGIKNLIPELKAIYSGEIIIALDCDNTGKTFAPTRARNLIDNGYKVRAIDLQLHEKGDIADFCKLHGVGVYDQLLTMPEIAPAAPKPIFKARETTAPKTANEVDWEAERVFFWRTVVLPAIERTTTARKGKMFRCVNPAHPDNNPSSRISTDKNPDGLYMCNCCRPISRELAASWVGLDFMTWWNDNRRHLFPLSAKPEATKPAELAIKADLIVDTQYISNYAHKLPKTGVIVVISATATGKSTLNKRVSKDKSTLFAAPFKSLVDNGANAQEIDSYLSVPHEYRSSAKRLAICIPSLKGFAELLQEQFPQYDVLQLDELSRSLEMFGSREIFPGNDATIVMSVLEKLIKNTPLVMVTDAYAGQVEIDYLKSLRDDVFVVVNTYQRDYGKLVIYPEPEQLQSAIDKAIKANKGAVVFVSTSKAEVERQEELWGQKYGKDKVISIHSGNATNKLQREFLKVIGDSSTDEAKQAAQAKIESYACALASPSLLTGFDAQPKVYRVFGNLYSNDIDAAGCMQLLHRWRNAEETHVYIEPKERKLPTSAEYIYNCYRTKADRTAQLVKLNEEDNQPDFDGIIERMLRQQSAIEARRNRSLNNLYESFLELAKPHYEIEQIGKDAPAVSLNVLKEASEAVKARQKELALTVAPLSPEIHLDKSERGLRTEEDNAGLERWYIENLYRQPITEDLYDLYAGGKGASELHTYIDVMHKPEIDLKTHDSQQITDGVPLHLRDHRAMKSRTIKRVLAAIFGQRRNITDECQLTGHDITKRFNAYADLHPDLLEDLSLYCGLSRTDASRDPVVIVKRVARLMGWALRQQGRYDKNTSNEDRVYAPDTKALALMETLAKIRLAAIEENKLHDLAEEMQKKRRRYISLTAENLQAQVDVPSPQKQPIWIRPIVNNGTETNSKKDSNDRNYSIPVIMCTNHVSKRSI